MRCSVCGVAGVRLWRTTHVVASAVDLFCVACGLDRERDHITNNTSMCRTLREHLDSGSLGHLVAARPTEGGSYWGHTSGPESSVNAWITLPFHAPPTNSPKKLDGSRREEAQAFFADMAQHEWVGGALAALSTDDRRALAERVREACAKRIEWADPLTVHKDTATGLAILVRALDLDAVLGEDK